MTSIENVGTDTTGMRRPILANLALFDLNGNRVPNSEIQVAVEGDTLFLDDGEIGTDLTTLGQEVTDAVLRTEHVATHDLNWTRLLDFDFEDAPRVPWQVLVNRESDSNDFRCSPEASGDNMALAKAAMDMAGRDRSIAGMAIHDMQIVAATLWEQYVFQPPIPVVVETPWLAQACDLLEEHADSYPEIEEAGEEFTWSPQKERRGPEGNDDDILISFGSDDPRIDGDLDVIVPAAEFQDEVGDIDGYEVDPDTLLDFLKAKAKDVASRHVDYDSFGNDSQYLDRLDEVIETLSIRDMGRIGRLQTYEVDAVYYADPSEGVWEDTVAAVDSEDAVLQATIAMSGMKRMKGTTAFETLDEQFGAHRVEVAQIAYDFEKIGSLLERLTASKTEFPVEVRAMLDEYEEKLRTFEAVSANRMTPHVPMEANTMPAPKAPTP